MHEERYYQSPLTTRYAAEGMKELFGAQKKVATWRRLWFELAKAQQELGLKQITDEALQEMQAHLEDIDFQAAREREREVRHDVMAHLHVYGLECPAAAGIMHLGATSQFINDNTELLLIREATFLLCDKLLGLLHNFKNFAERYASQACLGSTHFQVAQLTTVGKRACIWLQDCLEDYRSLKDFATQLPTRGVKGTTGTQASFLALFNGDHEKVLQLEEKVCTAMGFERAFPITGQTYPRKLDHTLLSKLAGIGVSLHKFASDIRLLMGLGELEEPFENKQIGSSAMAYKRNPMRSERICSLSRNLLSFAEQAGHMASQQWLERTLDDSAIRRIIIPEAFLTADIILSLANNVTSGLVVNKACIERRVSEYLPFMVTEEILMEASRRGIDRQEAHEKIREHSQVVIQAMRQEGASNDLLQRIQAEALFSAMTDFIRGLNDPQKLIGRAPEQVQAFLSQELEPLLNSAGTGSQGDPLKV